MPNIAPVTMWIDIPNMAGSGESRPVSSFGTSEGSRGRRPRGLSQGVCGRPGVRG